MSINLYEHPRKLYKYFSLSKDFAVKMFTNDIVELMFTPNLQREEAEKIGKVIDKWRSIVIDGYIVSAKYSCGFLNPLSLYIIVDVR